MPAMTTRRHFLQKISASAVAVTALPRILTARKMKEKGPLLRVAIMGLGSYGNRVADAMRSCTKATLAGAVSGTPGKLTDWQNRFGIPQKNCYSYDNFDDIRNNPDIDVVYITTPNALHHDHTIRAAKAGKHVICEKPMALNAEQASEMIDACRTAGVQLLIGYRLHFEPKTLEVIRMRKAGDFGRLQFFDGQSGFRIGDPTQWRLKKALAGGGSLMDIGIYSINGARYMTGEDPVWVTAQETKTDPVKFAEGVDETIQFQLGFPGGAVASCLSTYAMNNLDRFFLNGEKGWAEMWPSTGYGPLKGRTHKGELTQPHITQQTLQVDGMADIILRNQPPVVPVDGQEGLKDMKIIDAIYTAVRTGEKIRLSL
jgi:predicted dehydrogenase